MLCERCKKNEATAYIKTNVNGDVHEYHLCPACAAEMQESGEFGSMFHFGSGNGFGDLGDWFSPMSGFDMVSSLLSSPFGAFGAMPSLTAEQRCPVCGSDFRSIADSGKVGCPECYRAFKARLAPTIQRIHGNTIHCGKHAAVKPADASEAPAAATHAAADTHAASREEPDSVASLKKQLGEAVSQENYELAAELRDKIRAMEA